MRFAASILFLVSTALAAPWDSKVLQDNTPVGGDTGSPFSIVAEQGAMVKTLRIWRESEGRQFIRGIDLTFTDNKKASTGKQEKQPKEFTFEADEVITQMSLWGDGIGTKTGRIFFKTNKGREFLHGRDQPEAQQTEFVMEVGSGILIGFSGKSGEDVDHMAPVFLKTLKKERRIEDLKFETFDLATEGLELESVNEGEFRFEGAPNQPKFLGSVERTVSTSFEDSTAAAVSFGFTVSGEIPQLVSVELSAEWEFTKTTTVTKSVEEKITRSWELAVDLKGPEDSCSCTASIFKGTLDLSYTGTLVIETLDSGAFRIPTSGRMKRVQASKIVTSCKKLANPAEAASNVASLPVGTEGVAADLVGGSAAIDVAATPADSEAAVKRDVPKVPRRGLAITA
ncbi:hypothetical protein QBC43DRAFT_329224 [Cladorrhinum sp. PSN259]|nr:hypothetical protein QBC43DRAFT_329224 [Cladorrhinum sp. PSN259]